MHVTDARVTRTLHFEQDVTITRVSLSNAAKLKDGSRCKLMALGDGYDDWIAVCTFLVGTEESCAVRLHVAAMNVVRIPPTPPHLLPCRLWCDHPAPHPPSLRCIAKTSGILPYAD